MSDVLVRGIPKMVHHRIRRFAKRENLSLNQALIQLIVGAMKRLEEKDEEEERRAQAFERLERLREEIRKKYGRQEDSTKLIREARDERSRRW